MRHLCNKSSSAAAGCGNVPTLDFESLGPQVLQTKSSNADKDWWRSTASLTHIPSSSDRTSGCLGEVMLDKLSTVPKPLAATVLGSVAGNAAGGGLGDSSDNGM